MALLLALAACGAPGTGKPALDRTHWRLTGWTLDSLDPNDFTITAQFSGGRVSGKAAVNSYDGSYSAGPGEAFSVGALTRTEMGGPEPAMRAENAFVTLLGEARSYRLASGTLTLYDTNGNESLIFQAATR